MKAISKYSENRGAMKIAVLGAGAMGSLFGGYLSKENEVWLIDVNAELINQITDNGVSIQEKDGSSKVFHPKAVVDPQDIPVVDLLIVFVKSMYTTVALARCKSIIGSNTYVMTLQNGIGHEKFLKQFAKQDHIVIGSTQHNSSVLSLGKVMHGGCGKSYIGLLDGDPSVLYGIVSSFKLCGFDCEVSSSVRKQIWDKLFINTSASALTAVFQSSLGFIVENKNARKLMHLLTFEAVNVANALGLEFDYKTVVKEIEGICTNAKNAFTSIYEDVREGRVSEVDTISGSVVAVAREIGIPVPYHEMLVLVIHAIEEKNRG